MRIEGLVQLKTGDAVRGVISRRLFIWRYLKVDNVTAISRSDPEHPAQIPGTVLVPKANISFIQQLIRVVAE